MIWPADVSAWLVDLMQLTGQSKGIAIIAGISLWYSAVISTVVVTGFAVYAVASMIWRRKVMLWIRFAPLFVAIFVYLETQSVISTIIVASLAVSFETKGRRISGENS